MQKKAAELVADAKSRIENLHPDSVENELEGGGAALVDIRDALELQEHGRIPGAIHIPAGCWSSGRTPRARTTWNRSIRRSG